MDSKFYRGDARRQLHQQLEIIQGVYKKKVVTIVDEAHLLDRETLEKIRFLLNTKIDSHQPMSLILVGQSELKDKLKKRQYTAIRQRIDIKCEIRLAGCFFNGCALALTLTLLLSELHL